MSELDEIKARLAAISPGKWEVSVGASADGTEDVTTRDQKTEFLSLAVNDDESQLWMVATDEVIPAVTGDGARAQANAEFIAHAPETQAKLIAALEAVGALHVREVLAVHEGYGVEAWCPPCREHWPCPTIAAIKEALQ